MMTLLDYLKINSTNRLFPVVENISKNTEEFLASDVDKYFSSLMKSRELKQLVDNMNLGSVDFEELKSILSNDTIIKYESIIDQKGENINNAELADFIRFQVKSIYKPAVSVKDKFKKPVNSRKGRPILEPVAYVYKKNNDPVLHRDHYFSYYIYDNKII
jgi:hypothetical protein